MGIEEAGGGDGAWGGGCCVMCVCKCKCTSALSCWSLNGKCISSILPLCFPHDFWFGEHICVCMIW